jgi:proteasome lid subunit RPN8/RPN11
MPILATWPDPDSLLRIEYSREAMGRIRARALEGLKARPNTGRGIGGLLLGERAGADIRILDSVDLPCSYKFGPHFTLTPDEKARGRELVERIAGSQIVGWYCSKPGGELTLSETDLALFRYLFPAQWQITFLVQPAVDQPTCGAFFFANQSGVVKGVEREMEKDGPPTAVRQPPAPLPDPVIAPRPGFFRRFSWLFTAVAALVVGAAAFEIQDVWRAKPVPSYLSQPGSSPPAQIP